MFEVEIKVNGTVVSVQNTEPLYSGSADIYNCSFSFDESWDGFSRSAVFRVGGRVVTAVLDEEGVCTLPWELLTRANIGLEIEVGVYGVSAAAEVLTSVWDSIGTVHDGSEIGNDAREPGAGVYDQVMASVKRIDEKVQDYSGGILAITQRAESAAKSAQKSSAEARETVAEVDKEANRAENAMAAAQAALSGVRKALDDLPEGDTLIVNDLTTGGAAAALSAEMGKLLAQRSNHNLFHNWYFANAVNQRGQTAYTAKEYTVDCWKNAAATTITVVPGKYVTCSPGTTLQHPLEADVIAAIRDIPVTFSLLTDTGLVYGTAAYDGKAKIFYGSDTTTLRLQISGKGHPYITANTAVNIIAAKFEIGSVQTLAHLDSNGKWVLNEIPDYAADLRKCMRYFQVINRRGASNVHLLDVWGSGNTAIGTLPLSVPMRATPTATISGKEPTVWLTKQDGDTMWVGTGKINSIAVSSDTADVSDIDRLRLEVTASVDSDAGFVFAEYKKHDVTSATTGNIGTSSRIFLDANL